MISEAEARAWIEAYGKAWETRDPEKIVQLYTNDAGYRERRFHPGIRGIDQIRDYWELIVHELQRDVGFEVVSIAVTGDTAFYNWRSHFTWRPINGIMELDAVSRVQFSSTGTGPGGLRLAANFEEWIDHREA